MATANQFISSTRTAQVPLTFEENGERKTDNFKVVFRALSPKLLREIAELENEGDDTVHKVLARLVVQIPEITNGGGQPIEITEATLEEMATDNLMSIHKAILADTRPTQAPATRVDSPVSSAPATEAKS